MSDAEMPPLEAFPRWLKSLGTDFRKMAEQLAVPDLAEPVRLWVAGAVGYLFKSLDLIPDGVEDLGFLDDAFVLRVAAKSALMEDLAAEVESPEILRQLAADASIISEFMGSDMVRLEEYVSALRIAVVRGRSPADICTDPSLTQLVIEEARSWSESYVAPDFTEEEKSLVKLKSFLRTKLP